MINHVRTLLLNRPAVTDGLESSKPGAEFIDPVFHPRELPAVIHDVHKAILPDGYTPYQRNVVLACIMRILHAPDLEPYTLAFDPRITYNVDGSTASSLRDSAITLNAWKDVGTDTELIYTREDVTLPGSPGAVLDWSISCGHGEGGEVTVQYGDTTPASLELAFNNNYTRTVDLLSDYLTFRLYSPSNCFTGAFRFDISFYTPVNVDIPGLLEQYRQLDLRLSAPRIIFDAYPPYEAQLGELKRIWTHSADPVMCAGAYTLGLAYQLERLRLGGRMMERQSTLQRLT